jgi:propanol-preferring alcohol dehydrogenase
MKGWLFEGTGKPLRLIEKDDPQVKPGWVALDVKAAGLCHSDVGALDEDSWEALMDLPVVLGHEISGQITAVGEGVTDFKVGDRVGVWPSPDTPRMSPGYNYDGGYATKTLIPANQLIPIPDGVDYIYGAAATDAGMTSHHALVGNGGVKEGTKVGIIGIGGLGQVATAIAVALGAKVYVSSRKEAARQAAFDLGVTGAVATAPELAQFECDVIVDFAGAGSSTGDALGAVKPGGKVVLVGMGNTKPSIDIMPLILGQRTLQGSMGGGKEDIKAVYDLMASGKLKMTVVETTFDEIPAGLDKLRAGEIRGRLVAVM